MNESAMSNDTIHITVNGETRAMPAGTTIADLVASLELQGRRVAVECNLEIVHAIGGG